MILGGVDAVNKLHMYMYVVSYQLRFDNVLPATSLALNSQLQLQKARAEALLDQLDVLVHAWLVFILL